MFHICHFILVESIRELWDGAKVLTEDDPTPILDGASILDGCFRNFHDCSISKVKTSSSIAQTMIKPEPARFVCRTLPASGLNERL